jgi:cell division protein FtsN
MTSEFRSKKHQKKPEKSIINRLSTTFGLFFLGYLTATIFDYTKLAGWVNEHIFEKGRPTSALMKDDKVKPAPSKPEFEFYTLLSEDRESRVADESTQSSTKNEDSRERQTASKPLEKKPSSMVASKTTETALNDMTLQSPNEVTSHESKGNSPNVDEMASLSSNEKPSSNSKMEVTTAPVSKPTEINSPPSQRGLAVYTIQVAALKTPTDAERIKGKLVLNGFHVGVMPVNTVNGRWYRVIVGPYAGIDEAMDAKRLILARTRLNGMVRKGSG